MNTNTSDFSDNSTTLPIINNTGIDEVEALVCAEKSEGFDNNGIKAVSGQNGPDDWDDYADLLANNTTAPNGAMIPAA